MLYNDSFLGRVGRDLIAKWGVEGLEESIVFLPSMRGRLFLSQHLSQEIEQPCWLPEWGDIKQTMEQIAQTKVIEPMLLIPSLHRLYCAALDRSELLEDFYHWGAMMLHDFDQVDKYLVEPDLLFQNLADLKELERTFTYLTEEQQSVLSQFVEEFAREPQETSPLMQRYLDVWHAFPGVYHSLHEMMDAQKEGYEGYVFRKATNRLRSQEATCNITDILPQRVAFVGFNALNACEHALFQAAQKQCETLFYWNYADYFVASKREEAGHFIRENLARYPNALGEDPEPNHRVNQKVRIISVPSVLAQADALKGIMEQDHHETSERQTSALILADESLLLPVLQALPDWANDANVTMGYPIRNTVAYPFIEAILTFMQSYDPESDTVGRVALTAFAAHPYSSRIAGVQETANRYAKWTNDRIEVRELTGDTACYEMIKDGALHQSCRSILRLLREVGDAISPHDFDEEEELRGEDQLTLEYLSASYNSIALLEQSLRRAQIDQSPKLIALLLPQLFRNVKASFLGQPLDGLQIMGFLESRTLDFEHVTIISCNEQFLPGDSTIRSFILSSLSRAFGMPTPQAREAMYSYYFHSIIARAKQVDLVYVSSASLGANGEPSRYILQLEHDPHGRSVSQINFVSHPHLPLSKPIQVEKRGPIRDILAAYLQEGGRYLSPTALSTYLQCPLQFYFSKIARIQPPDEILTEELNALEFGNIAHNALQALYSSCLGREIDAESLDKIRERIEEAVTRQFWYTRHRKAPYRPEKLRGIEILGIKTISKLLNSVVDHEYDMIGERRTLCALEYNIRGTVPITADQNVYFGGRIDRVDKYPDGTFAIIDYKSGSHSSFYDTITEVSNLFTDTQEDLHGYVLQLFLYCELINSVSPQTNVRPVLWFLRGINTYRPGIFVKGERGKQAEPITDFSQYRTDFKKHIQECLANLFDYAQPFLPTEDPKVCEYCPYKMLCNR